MRNFHLSHVDWIAWYHYMVRLKYWIGIHFYDETDKDNNMTNLFGFFRGFPNVLSLIILITSLVPINAFSACPNKINGCCYTSDDNQPSFTVVAPTDGTCNDVQDDWAEKGVRLPITFWVGESGYPYANMARDINELMRCKCMRFDIQESDGSNKIIDSIKHSKIDAKFGIVQSDLLSERIRSSEEVKADIRVIAKLHPEHVHLIVQQDSEINKWTDLAGKSVHIGVDNSGTRFTAGVLLGKNRLNDYDKEEDLRKYIEALPKDKDENPIYEIDFMWPHIKAIKTDSDAIDSLEKGDIDAMFLVAGAPAETIANRILGSDTKYRLVTIPKIPKLSKIYKHVTIPDSTYDGVSMDINTYVVDALLVTFNWIRPSARCEFVTDLYSSIKSNLDELKKLASPSTPSNNADINWKNVDSLDVELNHLVQSDCIGR